MPTPRQLRFLGATALAGAPELSRNIATGACSNFPQRPFLILPIGAKSASSLLTVSAPNSSQKCNLLQNRRPCRTRPVRPIGRHRRVDVSPHHHLDQGYANVVRGGRKYLITPCRSTSCTPTSSAFFVSFCHRSQILGRVLHPRLKRCFVTSGRTGAFQQSVHRSCPREGRLPLFQLAHDPFDASATKLNLLYTPRTAWTPFISQDPGRGRPARRPLAGQRLKAGSPMVYGV